MKKTVELLIIVFVMTILTACGNAGEKEKQAELGAFYPVIEDMKDLTGYTYPVTMFKTEGDRFRILGARIMEEGYLGYLVTDLDADGAVEMILSEVHDDCYVEI